MEDRLVLTSSKAVIEAFEQEGAYFEELNHISVSSEQIDGDEIERVLNENPDFSYIESTYVIQIMGRKGGDTSRWK